MRCGWVILTSQVPRKGDDNLIDILGSMGALDGPAKEAYEAKQGIASTPTSPSPQVEYDEIGATASRPLWRLFEAEIQRLNETKEHKAFMLQLDREVRKERDHPNWQRSTRVA